MEIAIQGRIMRSSSEIGLVPGPRPTVGGAITQTAGLGNRQRMAASGLSPISRATPIIGLDRPLLKLSNIDCRYRKGKA